MQRRARQTGVWRCSRRRGFILFACHSSSRMRQCAGRSSVFGDGRVIRCSLVGFEWCALDGQESGVVPFGSELVKSFWENCLATRRWRDDSQLARRFEIVSARSGTKFTLLLNSGGPDKRNTMNNERKFYHFRSGVCWLITMCKDHGALRPSA